MIEIKHVAFDLDGVLIDSVNAMEKSWGKAMEKLNYNYDYKFDEFKLLIGYPFYKVLSKLKIPKKDYKKVHQLFMKNSILNIKYIKKYRNVDNCLLSFKKKNIKISLVTSKNKIATKKILKHLFKKISFDSIVTSGDIKKGFEKPKPDPILKACKIVNIKTNNTVYVGDMYVDNKSAKNAGVLFFFAKWGYGTQNNYKHKFLNLIDLKKFILR